VVNSETARRKARAANFCTDPCYRTWAGSIDRGS